MADRGMTEFDIKIWAHIMAIDHLLADLHVANFAGKADSLAAAEEWAQLATKEVKGATLPMVDPVLADACSDEFEQEAKRLIAVVLKRAHERLGPAAG